MIEWKNWLINYRDTLIENRKYAEKYSTPEMINYNDGLINLISEKISELQAEKDLEVPGFKTQKKK